METWYHLGVEGGGTVNGKEISEKQCYEKALLSDPNNAGGIALLSLVSLVCSFLYVSLMSCVSLMSLSLVCSFLYVCACVFSYVSYISCVSCVLFVSFFMPVSVFALLSFVSVCIYVVCVLP